MSQIDRQTGLVGNTGCKVPARVASTAALTLSGLQTVDGVVLVQDDRVLVKDQAVLADNGVYTADTGDWSRAPDFDGTYDIVDGSIIRVTDGSANGGGIFEIVGTNPITITEDDITFSRLAVNFVTVGSQIAAAGQTVVNLSTTYQPGSSQLAVYVNGLRCRAGTDYTETSASRITFTYALQALDEIDYYVGEAMGSLVASSASQVALADVGDFYVATSVEGVFQEIADGVIADNGDTSQVLSNASSPTVQIWNTPLTANRTATLSAANAKEGAHFVVVRASGATGNFTLVVGSALCTLRAPGEWCEVRYDAATAAWILEKYGLLPSSGVRSVGSDNGDADQTLTVGTSAEVQRWSTTLTADRTGTLATAGAWSGAKFRVIRSDTALGNFALVVAVAGVTLLRLMPGQWANFEYTGSAWIVSGFGDLRLGNTAYVRLADDYAGEEIDGYRWQSTCGTDPNARQAVVLADQLNGVVRMTTGADAGGTMALNGVQLFSHLNWRASKGCLVWEGRVAISAITNVAIFVGLTDQRAALEAPFTLAGGDVLTSNATDAVGVLFDTNATTDTWWLVGVAADVDAVKQNTGLVPVAATFETWRIEVSALGVASFYRNGTLVGTAMASAVTPSVQLTPVVAAFSRTNVSINVDVDEQTVQQIR